MKREQRDKKLKQLAKDLKEQGFTKAAIIRKLKDENFPYLSYTYIEKLLYVRILKDFYNK